MPVSLSIYVLNDTSTASIPASFASFILPISKLATPMEYPTRKGAVESED